MRENVASDLLLDCFFIKGSIRINEKSQAWRYGGVWGCDYPLSLFQSSNVQLHTVKL